MSQVDGATVEAQDSTEEAKDPVFCVYDHHFFLWLPVGTLMLLLLGVFAYYTAMWKHQLFCGPAEQLRSIKDREGPYFDLKRARPYTVTGKGFIWAAWFFMMVRFCVGEFWKMCARQKFKQDGAPKGWKNSRCIRLIILWLIIGFIAGICHWSVHPDRKCTTPEPKSGEKAAEMRQAMLDGLHQGTQGH